jgi:hypothetical protein
LCAASKGRDGDEKGQAGNDVMRMHCDGGAMWMDDVVNLARDRCMEKKKIYIKESECWLVAISDAVNLECNECGAI